MSRSGRRHGILLGLAVTFVAVVGQAAAPNLVKVDADRLRFFTHTIEPVTVANGRPVYGCTEFVFRFEPGVLDRGDVLTIERRIDAWLPRVDRPR